MSALRGERADKPTFTVIERLGEDVFLTHHEIFDGRCVQKTVSMHGLEDALASNEPAFLNRLDHDRIVPVREAQWDPAQERAITFVMPLLAGGSVHDALLEDYRFSIGQAIGITVDVLDALAYLHREVGALHRDTKPGNVLLDAERKRAYLSDLGSAAAIDPQGGAAAASGTDIYRPPECRALGRVGPDADLYGVAMMTQEMLSGRIAWEDLDPADVEARQQRGLRAVPDRQLLPSPHVPASLRRSIRRAIDRDPARRPQSAEAFARELRAVRCIEWRMSEGSGECGTWIGSWPPRVAEERRVGYRIKTRYLSAGPRSGMLRVESDFRKPGGDWRQALADVTVRPGDRTGLSRMFAAVEQNAAHRSPLR